MLIVLYYFMTEKTNKTKQDDIVKLFIKHDWMEIVCQNVESCMHYTLL